MTAESLLRALARIGAGLRDVLLLSFLVCTGLLLPIAIVLGAGKQERKQAMTQGLVGGGLTPAKQERGSGRLSAHCETSSRLNPLADVVNVVLRVTQLLAAAACSSDMTFQVPRSIRFLPGFRPR